MLFRSDRKSTRLNSSHTIISYAVFCLKKKNNRRSGDWRTWGIVGYRGKQHTPASHTLLFPPLLHRSVSHSFRPVLLGLFFFLRARGPPNLPPLPPPPAFQP